MLAAWAGSFEKDVYFSTVPSQKSTLSSLATITEQLLWLGGPAPACLTLLLFCQPKKTAFAAQNSHPVRKNRRKGRHKGKCDSMCLHPVKIAQIMEFLSTLVAAVVVEGAGFLNLHVAGCLGANFS